MIPNIRYICDKSAEGFTQIRFWTILPLALYGPLVVLNPWWRLGHLDRGRQFLVRIYSLEMGLRLMRIGYLACAVADSQFNYCYEL